MPLRERILVTGGCGYVGSHLVSLLLELGHKVSVVDDLSRGTLEALRRAESLGGRLADLHVCDITDREEMRRVMGDVRPEVVVHLAAFKSVAESVDEPERHHAVNVAGTQPLIDAMAAEFVERVVFASTACMYDGSSGGPLGEQAPVALLSPYAQTKHQAEQLLADFAAERGAGVVNLRFFNVAGAHPSGMLGEYLDRPKNRLPILLSAVRVGGSTPIFGIDYPTPDGTCVRDYVHVMDVAWACIDALEMTHIHGLCRPWNLGTGRGHSVREVAEVVGRITGRVPAMVDASRRAGDPATLVADASAVAGDMGWVARHDLEDMVAHAWAWVCTLRGG